MWLGLGPEVWLQLWSGVIGSILGATGAIGIALWVLRRTNDHQTEMASEALAAQRRIADEALSAQRQDARQALKEQRKSLNKQLKEQRSEASRARELSAIADFLSAVEGIVSGMSDPDWADANLSASEQQLESARVRMTFEPHSKALGVELGPWVSTFRRSVGIYRSVMGEEVSEEPLPEDAQEVALDAVSISAHMTTAAAAWPNSNLERRARSLFSLETELPYFSQRAQRIWDAQVVQMRIRAQAALREFRQPRTEAGQASE